MTKFGMLIKIRKDNKDHVGSGQGGNRKNRFAHRRNPEIIYFDLLKHILYSLH